MFRKIILLGLISCSFTLTAAPIATHSIDGLDKTAIKQADLAPILDSLAKHRALERKNLGKSFLGKSIDAFYIGSGPIKVMLWSQMHGDENTASVALMDFLSYTLAAENEQWRKHWQTKLSLMIIPMVNPDGAQLQTRFNAQGVDLNRDAKAQRTPEGQLLTAAAKAFKPDFAFNLHDQNAYYGAGEKGLPATISVLAPAYNTQREINESRGNAMKLIAQLSQLINQQIPGHLAKYNDSYSYRSFGDTFSEMGISTILIESGAYPNDPHRQVARKVNRMLYVQMIDELVSGKWQQQKIATYQAIPFNAKDAWVDLLIDDVTVTSAQGSYITDIAINAKGRYPKINELGDISSIRQGFTQLDAQTLNFDSGKVYPLTKPLDLTSVKYRQLLSQGYSCFSGDITLLNNQTDWVSYQCGNTHSAIPERHGSAAFILREQGTAKYAVLGEQLIKL